MDIPDDTISWVRRQIDELDALIDRFGQGEFGQDLRRRRRQLQKQLVIYLAEQHIERL